MYCSRVSLFSSCRFRLLTAMLMSSNWGSVALVPRSLARNRENRSSLISCINLLCLFFGLLVKPLGLAYREIGYEALLVKDILKMNQQIGVVGILDKLVVGPIVKCDCFVHAHLVGYRVLVVAQGGADTVDLPALY